MPSGPGDFCTLTQNTVSFPCAPCSPATPVLVIAIGTLSIVWVGHIPVTYDQTNPMVAGIIDDRIEVMRGMLDAAQ